MARLKIPGSSPEEQKHTHKTCSVQSPGPRNAMDSSMPSFQENLSSQSCNEENSNIQPLVLPRDKFLELFGESDEDESEEFHGFNDEPKPFVPTPRKSRRHTQLLKSPTDESNPYKKRYLSFRRDGTRTRLSVVPKKKLLPSPISSPKSPVKDDVWFKPVENDRKKVSIASKAAKNLLNKACKTRIKRKGLSPTGGLKLTIKYSSSSSSSRPRRTQKSTFDKDFVYHGKLSKKRKLGEISGSVKKEEKCLENKENMSEVDEEIQESKKKKARIKYANETDSITPKTKKVKVKNLSPVKQSLSPFKRATQSDLVIEDADGNCKVLDTQLIHKKLADIRNEEFLAVNNEASVCETSESVKIPEGSQPKEEESNKELKKILSERESGWPFWNSYSEADFSDDGRALRKRNLITLKDTSANELPELNDTKSPIILGGNMDRTTEKSVLLHSVDVATLKLKAVKLNGKIRFVNFDNRLVTFCGKCENCSKTFDCGKCGHCRCARHATRLLPCWNRRCVNPKIGAEVKMRKSNKKKKKKKTEENDQFGDSNDKEAMEKVELSFVNDHSLQHIDGRVEAQLEFKVEQGKKCRKTHKSSTSDVFTGLSSPIKPKLRSTMNELMTKKDPDEALLPRIEYGVETLVRLPWPNDTNEDAAWAYGHHLCFTTKTDFPVQNICFLCGSAGKEKMVVCTFCCECYHPYCLETEPLDEQNWCCDRCKRCTVCGLKDNLLMCDKCHDCYHAECLGPFYQRDTEGADETWVCGKCVKCIKCNRRTAGNLKTSKWSYSFSMCEACGYNWKRGNYCPVCEHLYNEDDDTLKMMFCSNCERWIHMECEGIQEDDYEILAELPEDIPYICKLCTGQEKHTTLWYKEVRDELNNGFLKIYSDIISHPMYKLLENGLTENLKTIACLESFQLLDMSLEKRMFSCVREFYMHTLNLLTTLNLSLDDAAAYDVSLSIFPNAENLLSCFLKGIETVFPWFSPDAVEETNEPMNGCEKELERVQCDEIIKNGHHESLCHDHIYFKSKLPDAMPILSMEILNTLSVADSRRCLFCTDIGDDVEYGAGRLLYAGVNEWVHINCALWSAEVYEDQDGRLKHVHDALKRGSKLKCEHCEKYGATIGCCFLKCPKSYHFTCAKKSNVYFLDDKKIYCTAHSAKANKNLILSERELSVPRRVLVDLARFKSLKRVQRGLDPQTVTLQCGSFGLRTLGVLNEHSDVKKALVPIGYRVTRIFWSTKDPRKRCQYSCEVTMLNDEWEVEKTKEDTEENETVERNVTYCHDMTEWQKHAKKLITETKKGVKRKLGCEEIAPCNCKAENEMLYMDHRTFLAQKEELLIGNTDSVNSRDHNFFPLAETTLSHNNDGTHTTHVMSAGSSISASRQDQTCHNKTDTRFDSDQRLCSEPVVAKTSSPVDCRALSSSALSCQQTVCVESTAISTSRVFNEPSPLGDEPSLFGGGPTDFACTLPTSNQFQTLASTKTEKVISEGSILSIKSPHKRQEMELLRNPDRTVNSLSKDRENRSECVTAIDNVKPCVPLNGLTNGAVKTLIPVVSLNKNILHGSRTMTNSFNQVIPAILKDKSVSNVQLGTVICGQSAEKKILVVSNEKRPSDAIASKQIAMPIITTSCVERSIKSIVGNSLGCNSKTALKAHGVSNISTSVSDVHNVVRLQSISPVSKYRQISYKIPSVGTKSLQVPLNSLRVVTTKSCVKPNFLQNASKLINIAPKISQVHAKTTVPYLSANLPLSVSPPRSSTLTISLPRPLAPQSSSPFRHLSSAPHLVNANQSPAHKPRHVYLNGAPLQPLFNNSNNIVFGNSLPITPVSINQTLYTPITSRAVLAHQGVVSAPSTARQLNDKGGYNSHIGDISDISVKPVVTLASDPAKILKALSKQVVMSDSLVSPPPLVCNSKLPQTQEDGCKTSNSDLFANDLTEEINAFFTKLKTQQSTALDDAGNMSFLETPFEENTYFGSACSSSAEDKGDSNISSQTPVKNDPLSYSANDTNPLNGKQNGAMLSFKREFLFRQLREYLRKNPGIIKVVGNVCQRNSTVENIPVVDLTEQKKSEDLVCYSAYLPEHLWSELIKAGIASKDIQNILRETKNTPANKLNSLEKRTGNLNHTSTILPVQRKSGSSVTANSLINPSACVSLTSLSASVKNAIPGKYFGGGSYFPSNDLITKYAPSYATLMNKVGLPNLNTSPRTANVTKKKFSTSKSSILEQTNIRYLHSQGTNLCNGHDNELSLISLLQGGNPHMLSSYSRSDLPSGSLDPSTQRNIDDILQTFAVKPKRKYRKRIKVASGDFQQTESHGVPPPDAAILNRSTTSVGPVQNKRRKRTSASNIMTDTQYDVRLTDKNVDWNDFIENTVEINLLESDRTKRKLKVDQRKEYKNRKQKKDYVAGLKMLLKREEEKRLKASQTSLKFIFKNEDGWQSESSSLEELWKNFISEINDLRTDVQLSPLPINVNDAYDFLGLTKEFVCYLVEQLPGGHRCRSYEFQHHLPCVREDIQDLPVNPHGCARTEVAVSHAEKDMFAWLASLYRQPPKLNYDFNEEEVLGGSQDLPVAMKYRLLKNTARDHVGVYRSKIQGRGLFCKKPIEGGEMIIEYSGEKIRAALTDRREEFYDKKGIGCYMFRIDDMDVVDATTKGNAARFINHSCEPNCFSKIISVDGCKKIVIFALRRIYVGEELTYDYKFAQEDDKLPCYCGAKKCRKYLN